MDSITRERYAMRYVHAPMTRACVVCVQVKAGVGYLDVSPADIMCLDCGKGVVAAMAQARRAQEKAQGEEESASDSR